MSEARKFLKWYRSKRLELWEEWEKNKRKVIESLVEYTNKKIKELKTGEALLLELNFPYPVYLDSEGKIISRKRKESMAVEDFLKEYCITPGDAEKYLNSLENPKVVKFVK